MNRTATTLRTGEMDQIMAALPLVYRRSKATFIGPAVGAALLVVAAAAAGFFPWLTYRLVSPAVLMMAALAGAAAIMTVTWLRWRSVTLVVEPTRLTYRQGIMTRNLQVMAISQIVSVDFAEPLGGEQIGLGDLLITTTGIERMMCPQMERCREIVYLLTSLIDANKNDDLTRMASEAASQDMQQQGAS